MLRAVMSPSPIAPGSGGCRKPREGSVPLPRRSFAGVLGVCLGGALLAFLPERAALAASIPADPYRLIPAVSGTQSAAPRSRVASAAEKKQVPKPPPPAYKPDDRDKHSDHHESEDESGSDCVNNCFSGGDCLTSFGSGLFQGPTPPPALVPATAFESEASRWAVGTQGWLAAPTEVDSVGLWDAPAEPAHPGIELGRLPHGSHVVVVETHAMASGYWVHVRPFDGVEPNGWVPSSLLTDAPAPKPAPLRAARPDPRWGLRLLFGGGGIGPSGLNIEYSDIGLRADVQYLRLMKKQWLSGFGFGYRSFFGHPKVAYQSGNVLDDPKQSRLQIYELGTRAGQRYGDRSGFRFDWMLGPTLTYVDERAKLNVYTVVAPNTLVSAGHRDDALGRWAGGGEFRTNFGWCFKSGTEWGLHFGAFMFAWEGHREHSLATDFVHSNSHGWDISLSSSFFQ